MQENDRQKLDDLHRFFMEPPRPGRPSRADQIDNLLTAVQTGKLSVRALLWLAGGLAVLAGAYSQIKGILPK